MIYGGRVANTSVRMEGEVLTVNVWLVSKTDQAA